MGSGKPSSHRFVFEDVDNKLKDTTTNYEKLAETIKGALEGELSTLQNISDALVANYKEEADQIKENIALLDEQAQTERDRHTEANQLIKDKYQTQKDELDEIRQRLEENYEIEMQRINALTPAEQELPDFAGLSLRPRLAMAISQERATRSPGVPGQDGSQDRAAKPEQEKERRRA